MRVVLVALLMKVVRAAQELLRGYQRRSKVQMCASGILRMLLGSASILKASMRFVNGNGQLCRVSSHNIFENATVVGVN